MVKISKNKLNVHIEPLNMNGLRGRVLRAPAKRKKQNKQILLLYGHHASIERMIGFAEELHKYGHVTLPDFPGFGGMQNLYRMNEQPTVDALADYLAAFVKMQYKSRRFTIVAMSFGFVVATRMLQKYPELAKKVDMVISIAGFVHHEDFKMKQRTKLFFKLTARINSYRIAALLSRYILLNRLVIYLSYLLAADKNVKMKETDFAERVRRISFEVELWQSNDVRTYAFTGLEMLRLNLCSTGQQIETPVTHVKVPDDRYFDNRIVEQHLSVVYREVLVVKTKLKGHAPTVIASSQEAAPFIPRQIRSILKA